MLTACEWEVVFQDPVHEADPMLAEAKIRSAVAVLLVDHRFLLASEEP